LEKEKKMKNSIILAIVSLGLMAWPASMARGAVSLTINGQDVDSIALEHGQSCTVEVVSDDSSSYEAYVGFDNGLVLGDFSHLETRPEAGERPHVEEYDEPTFYGYYIKAFGFLPSPSPGVHFVFEYVAQQPGETDLKLYDETFTSLIDSVHIVNEPPPPAAMGTAFTYQGSLMDTNSPANGPYDFQFRLYNQPDPLFAVQQGSTIDINDLDVIDGQFTVVLDFGSDPNIFNGEARWLQITVAQSDGSDSCTLTPMWELTPVPYAIYAQNGASGNDWMVSGDDMYSIPTGNVGIGTDTPGAKLDVEVSSGGAATIGSNTNSATGDYDVAMGYDAKASGGASTAMGDGTIASEYASTAIGCVTTASGRFSTAMGLGATASGENSIAMGRNTLASGENSTAMGVSSIASGNGSIAVGYLTESSGYYSTAMGYVTDATGNYSTAMGREIEAAGDYSVAIALADMDGAQVTQDNTMAIMGGNVGIGTVSPSEKLEVDGTVKATAFVGDGSGLTIINDSDWTISGSDMYSAVSGNVGIGTASPAAKLTVNGAILRDGSTMYGDNADTHINLGVSSTTGTDGLNYANAVVGGGWRNTASGYSATVGGGTGNTASDSDTTVGGGSGNTASEFWATVGGGLDNTASHTYATVGGGGKNEASGYYATVPGGSYNKAGGSYSFAAGRRAKANHYGTFVWADSTDADFTSTGPDQFLIRAAGNVGIGTTSPSGILYPSSKTLEIEGIAPSIVLDDTDGTYQNDFEIVNGGDKVHFRDATNDVDLLNIWMVGLPRVSVNILEITGGSDLSEQFVVSDEAGQLKPGMVVCIDAENPGSLVVSKKAYDRTVAGIASGAGGVNPGMLMGQKGTEADGEQPVALTGRVYCWADASNGPIEPGDLLTTSNTPGHAMKVTDYNKSQGATLGKAMSSLEEAKGLVLVLVSLQ
jgi:hypothetical protein